MLGLDPASVSRPNSTGLGLGLDLWLLGLGLASIIWPQSRVNEGKVEACECEVKGCFTIVLNSSWDWEFR